MARYSKDLREMIRRAGQGISRLVDFDGDGSPSDPNRPNYVCDAYREAIDDVVFARTVHGGTKAMRWATHMLPKFAHEEDADHLQRVQRAVMHNTFARTVEGMVGMLTRKPVIRQDIPDAIRDDLEDVDLMGRTLDAFIRELAADMIVAGGSWIVLDLPRVDEQPVSQAQADAIGYRPYWVKVPRENVINWRYTIESGRAVLSLLVYTENAAVEVGEYGEERRTRYRVLTPGRFRLYEERRDEGKLSVQLIDEGDTGRDYIPAVWCPAVSDGPFMATPPLLDLAYENVEHYRVRSDRQHTLHFASVPVPVFTGTTEETITWGADRVIFLPESEATATILEADGKSLESSRQELQDIEQRMAVLGLSMLVRETRAAETAEAKRIDRGAESATLATFADNLEDALNTALRIHADMRSEGMDEFGEIVLPRDFEAQMMEPSMIDALARIWQAGGLSIETLWMRLQQGEVLPASFDPEIELDRITGFVPQEAE